MGNRISVGCKLPQGLILEMGYSIEGGNVVQGPDYQRVALNGASQHSTIVGTLRSPSPTDLRPGITNGVDEELFDAWVKQHANTNIVKNGLIFKAKNAAEATAMANDLTKKKTGFEPVDPAKHPGIQKMTEGDSAAK